MFYGPKGHPPELLRFSSVLQTAPSRQSKFLLHETFSAAQQWLEVFKHVDANMPVVWNSNSYYREETAKLLAGFVDIYLLDFKYGSEDCAEKLSDALDYWRACTRNHLYAKQYGELII